MNKTIEEFKTAKSAAEKAIFTILYGLEEEYALSIEKVDLIRYGFVWNGMTERDKTSVMSVRVEAKLWPS